MQAVPGMALELSGSMALGSPYSLGQQMGAEQGHRPWKRASSGWSVSLGHNGYTLFGAAVQGLCLIPRAISYP